MPSKIRYVCKQCGAEAFDYEGRGFFKQTIEAIVCDDCRAVRNITVGGIISQIAPSFDSLVGRLCPQCGSASIRQWDGRTCPRCHTPMTKTEEEFWT